MIDISQKDHAGKKQWILGKFSTSEGLSYYWFWQSSPLKSLKFLAPYVEETN